MCSLCSVRWLGTLHWQQHHLKNSILENLTAIVFVATSYPMSEPSSSAGPLTKSAKRNLRKRKVAHALQSGQMEFGDAHDDALEQPTRIRLGSQMEAIHSSFF